MAAGYYRFPTVHDDTVVFVCEDDLWTVPASGGVARRLTANPGQALHPSLSPDGEWLAFTGRDEGNAEVYVMPATGGPATRLTFLGVNSMVAGWTPDGQSIVFASSAGQPFARMYHLWTIGRNGGEPEQLPTGPAMSISYGPDGGMVIGRNSTDPARWKRYKGGLTGDLWADLEGDGDWQRLVQLKGNTALPLWVGDRVYFVADHTGVGNLFSCAPTGEDLRQHTHNTRYYVRHPSSDGHRIVFHAGADLFLFDPATDSTQRIEVEFFSPQTQRKRRFVDAARYLQGYALHPQGHSIAVTTRGKAFSLGNWEGPVMQHGQAGDNRYRLATWFGDGKRLAVINDSGGEETLELYTVDGSEPPERLDALDVGRPFQLTAAPKGLLLALSNHRNELVVIDAETRTARVLDRSRHGQIGSSAWSPDSRWLAYSFQDTPQTSIIRLCRVESGEMFDVTRPVLRDMEPAFDPGGKYLYFLSQRIFNPVYDQLHFELSFPQGEKPFLVTLQADTPSPFVAVPEGASDRKDELKQPPDAEGEGAPELRIDLEGITERVIAFPVPEGRYSRIRGIKGKALFSSYPVEGALQQSWFPGGAPAAKGKLEAYDFETKQTETLIHGISTFDVSSDGSTLVYRAGTRLRVMKAGEKPKDDKPEPGRASGWLDLGRIKVSVSPADEWRQMYREAWRLQRDQFWTSDMSGIDWQLVYKRYLPLLERVSTRAEFSDLLWEMQGELGTSHAYEIGGDYRPEPHYSQGFLGADLRYDAESDSYEIIAIVRGDSWDEETGSPLGKPGVGVRVGDRLTAVNGRRVGRNLSPQELLVHQASSEVLLTFAGADGAAPRSITVKTLRDETPARYRTWVDTNRQKVHDATNGRIGYLHIPDMGARGFAEFHRGYLAEVGREGLIVDVRFNGGGHVSQLVLEKLARRPLGYVVARWAEPQSYPSDAVLGPMVALTNEQAGSDGDIFSHVFKLLKLGPLIGKRTWGGVIGIGPRDTLMDGSFTTQPEYSFWFKDVGWQVENYGTDPDIDVDIRPQDYAAGRDPQLERALAEIQQLLVTQPPALPDFSVRPQLPVPGEE